MKKKITIILAVLMLLTAFVSCGGVKKEDVIGSWVWTYNESKGGERTKPTEKELEMSGYLRIKNDTFEIKFFGEYDPLTWKLSGSKITTYSLEGKELNIYVYKDGELSIELPNGSKRIYIKQ